MLSARADDIVRDGFVWMDNPTWPVVQIGKAVQDAYKLDCGARRGPERCVDLKLDASG